MRPSPSITADETGVWCQDAPNQRWGIRWEEITRVSVAKIDTIDDVDTIVELDFEFGDYMELNSSFPGFENAMQEICSRLWCPADWRTRIAELQPDEQPITLCGK